jgi:5'-deoxynucleotidase YfbR-like HD superfamily hydrolase
MNYIDAMREQFKDFFRREHELTSVIRYHKYPVMYYRTNLWKHSNRLTWLIDTTADSVRAAHPTYNAGRAKMIAAVHDDAEMIIGDVQFSVKLTMSAEEIDAHSKKEVAAIEALAKKYPKTVGGFVYEDLMKCYEATSPNDLEAVVVKYMDKMDAYCEAYHELRAGNTTFRNGSGSDDITPIDSYEQYFHITFQNAYPIWQTLKNAHPFFHPLSIGDTQPNVRPDTPHTAQSLQEMAPSTHYNIWKNATLMYGGGTGREWLTDKIEG